MYFHFIHQLETHDIIHRSQPREEASQEKKGKAALKELRSIMKPTGEPRPQFTHIPPRFRHLARAFLTDLQDQDDPDFLDTHEPYSPEYITSQLRAALHSAEAGMECAMNCEASADELDEEKEKFIQERVGKANAAAQPPVEEDRTTKCRFNGEAKVRPFQKYETEDGDDLWEDEFVDCKLPKDLMKARFHFEGPFTDGKFAAIYALAVYMQDKIDQQQESGECMPMHPLLADPSVTTTMHALRSMCLGGGRLCSCEADNGHYHCHCEVPVADGENCGPVRPLKRSASGEERQAKRQRVEGRESDNKEEEEEILEESSMHVTQVASSSRVTLDTYAEYARESGTPGDYPMSESTTSNDEYFAPIRRFAVAHGPKTKGSRKRAASFKGKGKGVQLPE